MMLVQTCRRYLLSAFFLLGLSFLSLNTLRAQVEVSPVFAQQTSTVTITYDATQGTAGLQDCNCDVYLHSGLITDASTSDSDWKHVATTWGVANPAWKLNRVAGEDNLYEITLSIPDFYTFPTGTQVNRLAFVFRNADGTQEGKGPGGSDIFYSLYRPSMGNRIKVIEPNPLDFVADAGTVVRIRAASTSNASWTLESGGVNLFTSNNATEIDVNVIVEPGRNFFSIRADMLGRDGSATVRVLGIDDLDPISLPAGINPGLNELDNGRLGMYLYAPNKPSAVLLGSDQNFSVVSGKQMAPLDDGTGFYTEYGQVGSELAYQYLIDKITIADPFSDLILDPRDDQFIENVGYDTILTVTAQQGVASWYRPVTPFSWQNDSYTRPAEEDLVIYELLIRDFIADHSYQGLIDSLDYFTRLGINAIELMPVNEFEGNLSWGYNPSYHNAIDKYYGPPEDLKAFIDAAHGRGIAVLVDVVFNHGFGQNPYVQLYANERATAAGGAGIFYNQTPRHPFNVGVDANHESIHTKRYVGRILRHWLEEYHFDGYRFDLSKGFTQTNNPDNVGAWGNYDASRVAILKAYQDSIRAVDETAYVILEHFADRAEEIELTDAGMFTWGNMTFNYAEAAMGYANNSLYFVTPESRGFDNPRLVGYMESHDEDRLLYKLRNFGSTNNVNTRDYVTSLARAELASAFFYTTPGAKMLWQFGEYGYDYDINFNGRTGNKPIEWFLLERPANKRLFDVTAAMIKLRADYPVFARGQHQLPSGLAAGFFKSMFIRHPEMDVVVVGNFGTTPLQGTVTFPEGGTYYDYFADASLTVSPGSNVDSNMTLAAGEYHIYTSKQLPPPAAGYPQVVSDIEDVQVASYQVFPNPADDQLTIRGLSTATRIQITGALGRRFELPLNNNTIEISSLPAGLYHLQISGTDQVETHTFVKR